MLRNLGTDIEVTGTSTEGSALVLLHLISSFFLASKSLDSQSDWSLVCIAVTL